jgi:hypothetical protein
VTGPEASPQVMLKVWPAVTLLKDGLVNLAALATAKAAAAKMRLENCILYDYSRNFDRFEMER